MLESSPTFPQGKQPEKGKLVSVESLARYLSQQFVEPDWTASLDATAVIQGIPATTTVSGMFLEATVTAARMRGFPLSEQWAGPYQTFRFYPMRDLLRLMVELAPLMMPDRPLRHALRALGRTAPDVLLGSTVGKVVLGSAQGVHEIIDTISKTYPINLKPSTAEIVERDERQAVVRLTDVHFMDCHHVGVMEGTLRHAGVKGQVRIRPLGPRAMDYLLTW